ncbi:MAG: thermonuclease family protein [Candidatus Omnitrophica bacterium]|nr:thermonuclease family protein [Candidatus Omnitrophota bacterium]
MRERLLRCFLVLPFLLWVSVAGAGEETYVVKKVFDGDTVVLHNGEKVRLVGVSAPEIKDEQGKNKKEARFAHLDPKIVDRYAKKAKKFVEKEVEGKKVRLEFDRANALNAHKDKYNRTLAYVYRVPDGFFLNAEVIKQGYGFAYKSYRFPYRHSGDFKRYEKEASRNKRGMWGEGG